MDVLSRSLAVLALVCAVAAGTLGSTTSSAGAAAAAGDCTPGADWGSVRDDFASQTISLVNAHRTGIGLRALTVSSALQASAVWKARHMAKYNYMAHNDPAPPVGRTTGERMAACGVSGGWGENIAAGYPTPASVVSGWLNSPGHRANIENASYTAIGSGAAAGGTGQIFWAHTFSTSGGNAPAPPPPRTDAAARSRSAGATADDPEADASAHDAQAADAPAGAAGTARTAGATRGAARGQGRLRGRPAQFPLADAHAQAAGRRARARQQGGRAEGRRASDDRARLLQRPFPGPSPQGARARPSRRVGGLRLASPAGRARPRWSARRSSCSRAPCARTCRSAPRSPVPV